MSDPQHFITSVGASLSEDGRIAQLNVERANGQTDCLPFPAQATASILMAIEQALGQVFALQRDRISGHDPRAFYPVGAKRVRRFQGAFASDGTPVLSLILETGVRIDFALPKAAIPELIAWLEGFKAASTEPGLSTH